MKAGDILLFKAEKDWPSRLIAWGTNSPYAHVAVCVSSEMNLAIEAMTRGGVRARDIRKITQPYDTYRIKNEYRYDLNSTISYLVSRLNDNYDYQGVIFLGFLKLLAKIGIPLKKTANIWQKERDYFCSELCYEAFFHGGGIDIVPQVGGAETTSPGDIARSDVIEFIETKHGGDTSKNQKNIGLAMFMQLVKHIWNFINKPLIIAVISIWILNRLYNYYSMIDTLKKTNLYLPYAYTQGYKEATNTEGNRAKFISSDVPIKVSASKDERLWFGISNTNIASLKEASLTLIFPDGVTVKDFDHKWIEYQPNEQYSYRFGANIHNGMAQETYAVDINIAKKGNYIVDYYISGEDVLRKDKKFIIRAE